MGRTGESPAVGERYRIVVRGEFGELLSTAFADVAVTTGGGKTEEVSQVDESD